MRWSKHSRAKTPGLLLLTATPQQLGPEGHFARLRLLDPDRYTDLEKFLGRGGALRASRQSRGPPARRQAADDARSETLRRTIGARAADTREALGRRRGSARAHLVAELLDEFGTGRVMFRNTRAALTGFPERKRDARPARCGDGRDDARR